MCVCKIWVEWNSGKYVIIYNIQVSLPIVLLAEDLTEFIFCFPVTRRAALYVPGNDEGKIKKIPSLNVDCVILDCEDGVALNRKVGILHSHSYVHIYQVSKISLQKITVLSNLACDKYTVFWKKGRHQIHGDISVNCPPVFKILLLAYSSVNLPGFQTLFLKSPDCWRLRNQALKSPDIGPEKVLKKWYLITKVLRSHSG